MQFALDDKLVKQRYAFDSQEKTILTLFRVYTTNVIILAG